MKKKILFLVNSDIVIYNFRLELVECLIDEGNEVFISSPYGERIDDLVKLGCHFDPITMDRHGTNPIHDIRLLLHYRRIMKRIKPDIVFTYTIKPNIYGGMAAAALDIPYVVNITGLGTAVENPGILQTITTILYRISLRKVQKVFFQNQENMEFFLKRGIALGKHDLLPGSGVNLQRFYPMEYPNGNLIQFAFIARVMKEKGIDQYLEAAEYIRKKYPNTRFHVCGFCEQDYVAKLQNYQDQGIIVYHGMVRDIRIILKDMNCIIHPSYYPEGISNVLLESCACARPIITTDRSGCREVIEDGVNGFICREKDTNDLIKCIEKFLLLPYQIRKKMGLEGRKKVKRGFDRNIVVRHYLREIS